MRLTTLVTLIFATFLMGGCSQVLERLFPQPPIEVEEQALFCDLEEPRRFTQQELDWRSANAPWNLRKDFKTNLAWEEECLEQEAE